MPLKSLLTWLAIGALAVLGMIAIWPSPLESYPKPPRLTPDADRSLALKRDYDAWSEQAGQEQQRALAVFVLAIVAGSCLGQSVRLFIGWEVRQSFALGAAGGMLAGLACDRAMPISYLATIPDEYEWGIMLDFWPFSLLIALAGVFLIASMITLLLILAAILTENVVGRPL